MSKEKITPESIEVDTDQVKTLLGKIINAAQMIEFNSTYEEFNLDLKLSGIKIWIEDIQESISSIYEIKNQ
jgi:uncharacterized protein YbcV (DUF1398 family)